MPASASRPPPSFVSVPDVEARRMFAQALTGLSQTQRQAVLQRLRGVDIDTIATCQNITPFRVRSELAAAINHLRQQLSDKPEQREQDDWLRRCHSLLMQLPAPNPLRPVPAAVPPRPVQRTLRKPYAVAAACAAALAVLLGVVLHLQKPSHEPVAAAPEPVPVPQAPANTGPMRMPPPDAPEAPLTAPDFLLVLMQQQHPGVLDDLDFYVWLAEQDAVQ